MTGFAVVPYGNVVYSRPDFVENPLLPNSAGLSDGSLAKPYPVLAPEGNPNSALASNPTHDPHKGLNDPGFFQPGNFNLTYDLQRRRQVRAIGPLCGVAARLQGPGGRRRPARPALPQPRSPAR